MGTGMPLACSSPAGKVLDKSGLKAHPAPCSLALRSSDGRMWFRANTVHLIILMALQMSILGRGLTWRGRSGKLLILRLTPRWRRRAPAVAHSPEATRPAPSAVTPNSCCGQNGGPTPPAHSRRNDTAMWLRLWLPSFQQGLGDHPKAAIRY